MALRIILLWLNLFQSNFLLKAKDVGNQVITHILRFDLDLYTLITASLPDSRCVHIHAPIHNTIDLHHPIQVHIRKHNPNLSNYIQALTCVTNNN